MRRVGRAEPQHAPRPAVGRDCHPHAQPQARPKAQPRRADQEPSFGPNAGPTGKGRGVAVMAMLDDDAVHAHLLANRGFVPMRPLDADPEFAGPFLEYFMGSW